MSTHAHTPSSLLRVVTLLAVLCLVVVAAGCGGDDAATTEEPATEQTPAATETEAGESQAAAGRDLFVTSCGACHTLADAGTNGQVGPNLDSVAPDVQEVLTAIETGPGQMPENLLQGEEARQVAEYVAASAGG
jgi:mono/diheme cytochrome c family protein